VGSCRHCAAKCWEDRRGLRRRRRPWIDREAKLEGEYGVREWVRDGGEEGDGANLVPGGVGRDGGARVSIDETAIADWGL